MEKNRRNRMDLMSPEELAIQNIIWEVEKLGASETLTEAVILLSKAKDKVSDFVDAKILMEDPNSNNTKPEISIGGFM